MGDGTLTVKQLASDDAPMVYPLGSLEVMDDFTSALMFPKRAIVLAGGPTLPAVPEIRKAAGLKGKIVIGGKPAANLPLVICNDADFFGSGGSPCVKNATTLQTTTNEKGEFEIGELPLGSYDLAMKRGGKWAVDHGAGIDRLTPGKVKDLGVIRYR